jgi:hypothetical protein
MGFFIDPAVRNKRLHSPFDNVSSDPTAQECAPNGLRALTCPSQHCESMRASLALYLCVSDARLQLGRPLVSLANPEGSEYLASHGGLYTLRTNEKNPRKPRIARITLDSIDQRFLARGGSARCCHSMCPR